MNSRTGLPSSTREPRQNEGRQAGYHTPKECLLSCGHKVSYSTLPSIGDIVWCVRCDEPAKVGLT